VRLYVLANSAKLCQKGVKLNFNSFLQDGNIFWKGVAASPEAIRVHQYPQRKRKNPSFPKT
jgi:hypothetical protein